MANIKDVAKEAGVSIATVSNVLNNKKYVSEGTVKKVLYAANHLNYKTNALAAGLKSKKTNVIGVILPKITTVFFTMVLDGIEAAANKCGYNLNYFSSNYDIHKEEQYIAMMVHNWVDGLIISSCCSMEEEERYIEKIKSTLPRDKQIPIVFLERNFTKEFNSVKIDFEKAAYDAICHIIEKGRNKILHIGLPRKYPFTCDRINGYKKALEDHGIAFSNSMICEGEFTANDGYICMKESIRKGIEFDSVFCSNDQMSVGAIKALREAGKKIPEEVVVVGFDNIFVGTLIEPALTTVDVPKYQMGYRAVEILIEQIDNPLKGTEDVILDSNLIIRRSSDMKADNNWELFGW